MPRGIPKTTKEQTRVPDKVLKTRPYLSAFAKFQAAHPDMECMQVEIDDPAAAKSSVMTPRGLGALGWKHPEGHSTQNPFMDEDNNVYCIMMKPKAVLEREMMERDPRTIERRKMQNMTSMQKLRAGVTTTLPSMGLQQMTALIQDAPEEVSGPVPAELQDALEKGGAYDDADV